MEALNSLVRNAPYLLLFFVGYTVGAYAAGLQLFHVPTDVLMFLLGTPKIQT